MRNDTCRRIRRRANSTLTNLRCSHPAREFTMEEYDTEDAWLCEYRIYVRHFKRNCCGYKSWVHIKTIDTVHSI
jgi:hypothetical protein